VGRFLGARLAQTVLVVVAASVVVFGFLRLLPGDPIAMMLGERPHPQVVAEIRKLYRLDEPFHVQYALWAGQVLRGNLGISYITRRPVTELIATAFGPTVTLAVTALGVGVALGLLTGLLAAVHRSRREDVVASVLAFVGISVPSFFSAVLLIWLFSLTLGWLPPTGYVSPLVSWQGWARHMLLPASALGLILGASTMRMIRSGVLEVLGREYVRTARAKGLAERRVIGRHVLRNALVPAVTAVGLQLADLLGGAVIIESVFAIPGLGRLTLDSIFARDYPVLQASILMLTVIFLLANLAADCVYALIDPRIRYD
jgi:peptide/nickel transport system permease protein